MKISVALLAIIALQVACNNESPAPAKKESGKIAAQISSPKKKETSKKSNKGKSIPQLAPDIPRTKMKAIPTSEDFEKEASQTVAIENLEAELDRLEAEIIGVSN